MSNIRALTAYDLNVILEKRFGKRLNTDLKASLYGKIVGTLDSKNISISYDGNNYLVLSLTSECEELLNELLPIIKESIGGFEPICDYKVVSKKSNVKNPMLVLEWDFKTPDERIKDIVNGYAFSKDVKAFDINLYNGKEIRDYKEIEDKIYGIYPGSIEDVEKINNLNEIDLFLAIDSLSYSLWKKKKDISLNIDTTEDEYALDYMIYQTTKFGVDLSIPIDGNRIFKTSSYIAWYSFYKNHFKKNKDTWKRFLYAKKNNFDISEYLPKGNWKDLYEKQKTLKLK